MRMRTAQLLPLVVIMSTAWAEQRPAPQSGLVERARSFELKTPYVPPPGEPLEHHASGFAKGMCSAGFITGLGLDFAAENVGGCTALFEVRAQLGKPVLDRTRHTVTVTLPNGVKRVAKFLGDQGCVTLPVGKDAVSFK